MFCVKYQLTDRMNHNCSKPNSADFIKQKKARLNIQSGLFLIKFKVI